MRRKFYFALVFVILWALITHMETPKTYSQILDLAKVAQCFNWHRETASLSLIWDDLPKDFRLCVQVSLKSGRVRWSTLCDYDHAKNRWAKYVVEQAGFDVPDSRGLKALREYIRSEAMRLTRWPNPESFSRYISAK